MIGNFVRSPCSIPSQVDARWRLMFVVDVRRSPAKPFSGDYTAGPGVVYQAFEAMSHLLQLCFLPLTCQGSFRFAASWPFILFAVLLIIGKALSLVSQ
jgi:hypothetical protein